MTTVSPQSQYPLLIPKERDLKFMVVMSQGEVFTHNLNPNDLFTWSDGVNRSFAIYLVNENKTNLSIFESIFFDGTENRIWALPMSDNSGQNRFHIMARGFGNNITSIPYEAFVLPNIHNPNHKFLLHFEYNYVMFEAYLPYRLELLRLLSIILGDGGSFDNLTLDSYENTTSDGVAKMLVRISNETVGYAPCNSSQMKKILTLYRSLSTGLDSLPRPEVAAVLENYKLTKVELELIGPCSKVAAARSGQNEESFLSKAFQKTVVPITLITVIVIICCVILVVILRRRKLRSTVPNRKNNGSAKNNKACKLGSEPILFSGKTKHIPVIFADELDEQSSINQISAASPLILKNEKPPAKELSMLRNAGMTSLNHTHNGGHDYGYSFDHYAQNGSVINNGTYSTNLYAPPSQSSTMSQRYSPNQFRPPPPYKPPSKAIIPR